MTGLAIAPQWLKTLRMAVKGDYGAGWILEDQYGRFKIGRRETGNAREGRRQFVSTDLPFTRGSHRKVLNLIGEIAQRMQEQGLSLREAYELEATTPTLENTGEINWEAVANRYKNDRVGGGFVTAANYKTNEQYRIERAIALINASKGAASNGRELMRLYAQKHLSSIAAGGEGRKRNLLDVERFLTFAVKKCGAEPCWLPLNSDDRRDLIGIRQEAREDRPPIKPEQLFGLLDSLYAKPELRLAVALVGLFGLRPAELVELEVRDGNLYVGDVKRNRNSAAKPKAKRLALPLDIRELPDEGARAIAQYESGLVRLPSSILAAKGYKACGDAFRQYLERHSYWQVLTEQVKGLVPYSLRHGYAWRGVKYYERSIPLRDLAALMGHDIKTHMRHYGKWTDDESLIATVKAATATQNTTATRG